jgi:RNA polymerase sigma-70 factor (ECF subfamily)
MVSHPLDSHRRRLWALAYRVTGDAAEADDVVQETLRRAVEHPPPDQTRDMGPWLTRVAANLARDVLRRRRRAAYRGTWLPTPVPTEDLVLALESERHGPDARYEAFEGISLSLLRALETLGPTQRSVLILRDVLGYDVAETAEVLELTLANVRVVHHRARKLLALAKPLPSADAARTRAMLEALLRAIAAGDASALEGLMARDVVIETDANGRYHAAARPVAGAQRVARFLLGVAAVRRELAVEIDIRSLNGQPALVTLSEASPDPRVASHVVFGLDLDPAGAIARIWSVLGTEKAGRVRSAGTAHV